MVRFTVAEGKLKRSTVTEGSLKFICSGSRQRRTCKFLFIFLIHTEYVSNIIKRINF